MMGVIGFDNTSLLIEIQFLKDLKVLQYVTKKTGNLPVFFL